MEKLLQRCNFIAKHLLAPKGMKVSVSFGKDGSYSYLRSSTEGVIYVDPRMSGDPTDSQFELRVLGVLYHEIGHLLFTQFEPMGIIRTKEKNSQKMIPLYVKEHKKELLSRDSDAVQKLYELIFDNIYYHNLGDTLNMVEDAAIEVLVPGVQHVSQRKKNRIFACVASNRDYIFSLEEKMLTEKRSNHEPEEILKLCLCEFHQLGVIGYRTKTPTFFLRKYLGEDETEQLERFAKKGKFATKNTQERAKIAKVVLKRFLPLMEDKANDFLNQYLTALDMAENIDDLADMMSGNMEQDQELAIKINVPNASASCSTETQSEYEYELPQDEQEEIENEQPLEEDSQEQDTSESSSGDNSNSNEDNDFDLEQQEGEFSENNSSNSSTKSSTSTSDNSDGNDDSANQNELESNNDLMDSINENKSSSENSIGSNNKDSNDANKATPLPDMKQMAKEATEAIEDAEESEANQRKQNAENSLKNGVKKQKNQQRIGKNTDEVANCERDFHKGIKTRLHKIKSLKISDSGLTPYKDMKSGKYNTVVNKTANQINRIKMYSSQAKRQVGLRRGKLNTNSLYRSQSDAKCFKRTTPGKKKNVRIALLMDQSGSMCGTKMQEAIQTAYILAASCQKVNVPVSVWGHDVEHYDDSIELYKYLDYKERSPKALEKIFNAEAHGCNHDGLAIFQVAYDLAVAKQNDEELVLIVLSDGSPAGIGDYYGREAEKDISEIIHTFKKLYQINTIGITIETCSEEIEAARRIYGENTIVVEDSRKLPEATIQLLEKLVI